MVQAKLTTIVRMETSGLGIELRCYHNSSKSGRRFLFNP